MTNPPSSNLALSAKARRTHEQPISYLITEAMRNPKLINLAAGLVDYKVCAVDEDWSGLKFARKK